METSHQWATEMDGHREKELVGLHLILGTYTDWLFLILIHMACQVQGRSSEGDRHHGHVRWLGLVLPEIHWPQQHSQVHAAPLEVVLELREKQIARQPSKLVFWTFCTMKPQRTQMLILYLCFVFVNYLICIYLYICVYIVVHKYFSLLPPEMTMSSLAPPAVGTVTLCAQPKRLISEWPDLSVTPLWEVETVDVVCVGGRLPSPSPSLSLGKQITGEQKKYWYCSCVCAAAQPSLTSQGEQELAPTWLVVFLCTGCSLPPRGSLCAHIFDQCFNVKIFSKLVIFFIFVLQMCV